MGAHNFFMGQRSIVQGASPAEQSEPFESVLPARFTETSGGVLPSPSLPATTPQVVIVVPPLVAEPEGNDDDLIIA